MLKTLDGEWTIFEGIYPDIPDRITFHEYDILNGKTRWMVNYRGCGDDGIYHPPGSVCELSSAQKQAIMSHFPGEEILGVTFAERLAWFIPFQEVDRLEVDEG